MNTAGVGNKTEETVEIMGKTGIKIMGLADIRCKGHGSKKVFKGYLFIYPGGATAKNGMGFLIYPDTAKCILDINNC